MQFAWNSQTFGALSAGSAVLLGAFGSHGLKTHLASLPQQDQDYYTKIWGTASQYQMYHSIGMILSPIIAKRAANVRNPAWPLSAKLFAAGITLFSGSLYALVLTKAKWLAAITPLGGLFFAAGWIQMAGDANHWKGFLDSTCVQFAPLYYDFIQSKSW